MDEPVQDEQPLFRQALAILRGGGASDLRPGIQALESAAQSGEPDALCLLAAWTADGIGVRHSWSKAFDLLLDAALIGSRSAREQLALLAAAGQAQGPDLALDDDDTLRRLRGSIRVEDWIAPVQKNVLCAAPRVVAIKGFLSPRECAWLTGRGSGRLQRALLYGAETAGPQKSEVRTNSAFEINVLDLDMVVLMVKARIAAAIGVPTGFLEPPQVLHYEVGEQFAPHRDFLDPTVPGQAADFARRGQRIVTFLVYLNSDFEGGATDFPVLALVHKGGAGDALYFGNVDPSGAPDPRTLHAGLPPTSGEKWLFSQWIRNRAGA